MNPRLTLQLCTYNRAALLERVLEAAFEQTLPRERYEVVLVDDGSADATPAVIEAARARATCRFLAIRQRNAGLARARNAGIARARGERIVFIDDDVLPTPGFLAEHLRSHAAHPAAIVRGGVIACASFERLPAPFWSPRDYSGNFFWTSNVSVPAATLRSCGGFSERFREYGWEDIELGLRLRAAGLRAVFNPKALAFHSKPPPRAGDLPATLRRVRAQARTARQLYAMHPGWRVPLATGDDPLRRALARTVRNLVPRVQLEERFATLESEAPLGLRERLALELLAFDAYYGELERAAEGERSA